MPTTTTLRLRRARVISVLAAVVLTIGAFAAFSLITVEQTSAIEDDATREEVASIPPPSLSAEARSDGIHLSWEFDVDSVPRGWTLSGFTLWRWIAGDYTSLHNFPDSKADKRSYTDRLTGMSDARRTSGFTYHYAVNAYFHTAGDPTEEIGELTYIAFTIPVLPKPTGIFVGIRPRTSAEQTTIRTELKWLAPHLAWDSDSSFGSVTGYELYSGGELIARKAGNETIHTFDASERCPPRYKVRAVYGVFYSDFLTATQLLWCQ